MSSPYAFKLNTTDVIDQAMQRCKRPKMNIFFATLSVAYIAGIFLLAGSPFVSTLNTYNPYSFLHIPLYGMLSMLLTFSILPFRIKHPNHHNEWKFLDNFSINKLMYPHIEAVNVSTKRLFIPGLIAFGVGIADEIYQSFLPNRNASITDVLLDFIGIILAIFLIFRFYKK